MSVVALIAAVMLAPGLVQEPQEPPREPVAVEDVLVEGRRLEALTRDFVEEVGAPPADRGLARWRSGVCVGVINIRAEVAQALADRVSQVAMDYGLRPAAPGCDPNILIAFTDDAQSMTAQMNQCRRQVFRTSSGGPGRGNVAAGDFQGRSALRATGGTAPGWHVTVPPKAGPGEPGIRLRGGPNAPFVRGDGLVNKGRWVRDDLRRVLVVVDLDQVAGLMLPQLADYIAMVSLAQIDPEADTGQYATILNLFDDPAGNPGLTGWDRAYLRGLYSGPSERIRNSDQSYFLLRSLRRASSDEDAEGE